MQTPNPPTKPVSPTPPTMNSTKSDTTSANNIQSTPTTQPKGEISDLNKTIEAMGKAFQGTSTQGTNSPKENTQSPTPVKQIVDTGTPLPITQINTREETTAKTTQPPPTSDPGKKNTSDGLGLIMGVFAIGLIIAVAYLFLKKKKPDFRGTVIDYSTPQEEVFDLISKPEVTPIATNPVFKEKSVQKPKSNFEIHV